MNVKLRSYLLDVFSFSKYYGTARCVRYLHLTQMMMGSGDGFDSTVRTLALQSDGSLCRW
jgi:hypothetical protein